jgi:hypothetical protein
MLAQYGTIQRPRRLRLCGFVLTGDTEIGPKNGVLSESEIRLVPESWRSCKDAGIAAHQEGCY